MSLTRFAVKVDEPRVSLIGGVPKTTSLDVADYFDKQHFNVLRDIKNLDCSDEFAKLNFEVCYQNNGLQNGKPQPFYRITKNGFMFLVMGFTGEKAARFKEAYIKRFDEMEAQLKSNGEVSLHQHLAVLQKYSTLLEKYNKRLIESAEPKENAPSLFEDYREEHAPKKKYRYVPPLTDEEAMRIIRLRRMGKSITEITHITGRSHTTIGRVVKGISTFDY